MDQLRRELDDLRRTVTAQQTEIDALKRESGQASHAMNNEVMQRLAVEQKLEALEGEFREWKSSANGQTTVADQHQPGLNGDIVPSDPAVKEDPNSDEGGVLDVTSSAREVDDEGTDYGRPSPFPPTQGEPGFLKDDGDTSDLEVQYIVTRHAGGSRSKDNRKAGGSGDNGLRYHDEKVKEEPTVKEEEVLAGIGWEVADSKAHDVKPVKKEEHGFGDVVLESRFKQCGAVPYPGLAPRKGFHDQTVTRKFLSNVYGGSSQDTFSTISDEKRRINGHEYREFLCPMRTWNPDLPRDAGAPGLFLIEGDRDLPEVLPLFVPLGDGKWLYCGESEGIRVEPLSVNEWLSQSDVTRGKWIQFIVEKKGIEDMRARIYLRKQGRKSPTDDSVKRLFAKTKGDFVVSKDDVAAALGRGDERIGVICLKIVGYDEDFQRQLIEKFAVWKPPPPAAGKKKAKKGAGAKVEVVPNASLGKRKRTTAQEDADVDEDDGEYDPRRR